jgi:transcriptional regulator with XRE-family HTH domain
MKQMICPVCQVPHDTQVHTETGVVRGVPYSVTLPLLRCPRATDGLEYPFGIVEARAHALGEARDEAERTTPAELRRFREEFQLNQRELEELLGYGPRRVTEFERGKQPIPLLVSRVIRAIQQFPGLIGFLRDLNEQVSPIRLELQDDDQGGFLAKRVSAPAGDRLRAVQRRRAVASGPMYDARGLVSSELV